MAIKIIIGTIFIAVGIATAQEHSNPARKDYIIKAGTMSHESGSVDRLEETASIPLDPKKKPGWCFIVDPPNDNEYEVYSVTTLPSPAKNYIGQFYGQNGPSIKSNPKRVTGVRPFCFNFDPGDPVGHYSIAVYINGLSTKTINLTVVNPNLTPAP